MKRLFIVCIVLLVGCAVQDFVSKKHKDYSSFSIQEQIVFYKGKPLAKYQAKTYSLDGGELVEEYNLLLLDNNISNKQLIGNLIDFVSDRHQGADNVLLIPWGMVRKVEKLSIPHKRRKSR